MVEVTGPVADVPLNPIFSLAFKYPTRNNVAVPGSFNLSGANGSTFYVVGGDSGAERGYAVSLESLSLFKVVSGAPALVPGPFPALWRRRRLRPPVGRPTTGSWSSSAMTASRLAVHWRSADYVDWATEGFDPCPPKEPHDRSATGLTPRRWE